MRSTFFEAASSRCLPTPVEPVNDILRNRESSMIGSDTDDADFDGTTLTTPSGTPAWRSSSTKYSEVRGVRRAGFNTTVQPAASAGPILRVPIASGKFHGVMRKHGPTGRRETRNRRVPSGLVEY